MTNTDLKKLIDSYNTRGKEIQEASYLSLIKETTVEQEARIKRLLKPENYNEFFDYYFGVNSGLSLADAPCADFHQESYIRVYHNRRIIQLRQWFRGAAKSIHTNVGNILHLKQNDELFFALIIGQNQDLANILLADLQTHLEFNERITKDFGVQKSYGNWADGGFETKDGRFFKSLGINQPFVGLRFGSHRPDFASIDDCDDADIATNKKRIKKRVRKITGDLKKAYHFKMGRTIVPNNYKVRGGILDGLKAQYKNNKNFEVHTVNLSDDDYNPTWHQRMTKADVIATVNEDDYFTSQREDYNNPIDEGKRFKAEWIRFEKAPPVMDYFMAVGYWDLSFKANGDYKAYAFIGVANSRMYVLDVFCRRCDISVAVSWHYDRLLYWKQQGIYGMQYFDGTASQETVFKPVFMQESIRRKLYEIPEGDHTQKGDKHNRIDTTLANVLFNGTLVFDEALKGTIDMEAAKQQLLGFEKGTTEPDDFPDALENAVRKAQFACMDITESLASATIVQHKRGGY